jgi:hypothetical protein
MLTTRSGGRRPKSAKARNRAGWGTEAAPCMKAAVAAGRPSAVVLPRIPITGFAGCCAPATSGHAAAPPSPAMNSRRRICHPSEAAVRAAYPGLDGMGTGQFRRSPAHTDGRPGCGAGPPMRRPWRPLSEQVPPPLVTKSAARFVEWPGGLSPPGSPRTVREPLDSYGSRCPAVAMT